MAKKLLDVPCPNCGSTLILQTEWGKEDSNKFATGWYDGDVVSCENDCGFETALYADENGGWMDEEGNLEELI